jgi:hypothetical protein
MASIPIRPTPGPPAAEGLDERFHRLADTWHEATAHHSSSRLRYGHPAYQEIIAMGPPVLPLLLRDLEQRGRHWFTALHTITGADPVPTADAGNVLRMTEAWIGWARAKGYRW